MFMTLFHFNKYCKIKTKKEDLMYLVANLGSNALKVLLRDCFKKVTKRKKG